MFLLHSTRYMLSLVYYISQAWGGEKSLVHTDCACLCTRLSLLGTSQRNTMIDSDDTGSFAMIDSLDHIIHFTRVTLYNVCTIWFQLRHSLTLSVR